MAENTFVFIAGPYQAKGGGHDAAHWYEIDAHINEARLWATKLVNQKIPFFCPHMNSAHMEVIAPEAGTQYWYDLDNLFLPQASALLLIPRWLESVGAVAENRLAKNLGIPCYIHSRFNELVYDWKTNASGANSANTERKA